MNERSKVIAELLRAVAGDRSRFFMVVAAPCNESSNGGSWMVSPPDIETIASLCKESCLKNWFVLEPRLPLK